MLALTAALPSATARADGYYFTEQVGGAKITDQLAASVSSAVQARFAFGVRRGAWSVEGFTEIDINSDSPYTDYNAPNLASYGLALKRSFPLARHLDLYLRGNASEGIADGRLAGYAGRGLGFGAGIALKGKVPALGFLWFPLFFTGWGPKVTASLFIDDGYDFYRLHDGDGRASIDAQITHLSGGFSVGTDF